MIRPSGCTIREMQTPYAEAKRNQMISIEHYARRAAKTDNFPYGDIAPLLLGLFGEVGTLLSVLKKKKRDADAFFGYREALIEEIGDVLWYLNAVTRRSRIGLSVIFAHSVKSKLSATDLTFSTVQKHSSAPKGQIPSDEALMTIASQAGRLIEDYQQKRFDKNRPALRADLIEIAQGLIAAASSGGVDLNKAAETNLAKIESWRPSKKNFPPLFDDRCDLHPDERLPRRMRVHFFEREVNGKVFAYQKYGGILIGDRLTDNHDPEDDYRFHDVFHMAYAAILGWSPVIRALLKTKRKSCPEVDENEDGARAILLEEGLSAWIFERAKAHHFFENTKNLGLDILKEIKRFVAGYEPQHLPLWMWEKAILDGYAVFRLVRKNRGGIVIADLTRRSINYKQMGKNS